MAKAIDFIRMVQRGDAPPPPVAQLIGFHLTDVEPGRAVIAFEADGRHANPMGTLHGGVLCDIADAAMGMAYAATLDAGETFTTLELKINFFKPIWNARLEARARIVRRTRLLAYLECDVVDQEGSLVARAASTCMVLSGNDAAGR